MTDKPLIQQGREERSYYVQKSARAKPSEAAVDAAQINTGGNRMREASFDEMASERHLLYIYRCPQCGFKAELPPDEDPPVCPRCRIPCLKSGESYDA
uniref:Rubredoxin-like domain-containing protein n=1 Tax=bacterium enrichment culture clone fosmid MGS-K1 TaxID=1549356 RepID=A0A0B5KNR2_9BACT|nr:hypothetical protein [bacterium enrichment culture clone fosmid MGS-K1]